MKILLTGGSGMLGSAVKRELDDSGFESEAPMSRELNLLSASSVTNFLSDFQPEAIIHAAARVGGIQANIDNPYSYLTENIRMDSNLFGSAKKLKIQNLVYVGSTCIYPRDRDVPLREQDLLSGPLEPTNEGYALAKILGLKTVELMSKQFGLSWRTIIPSNMYGPGDHFEPNRSHLLAAIIMKVWDAKRIGAKTIEMWGDGSSRREFTYVGDVAKFIVLSLKNLDELPQYMNVGEGVDHSIKEYYEIVSKIMSFDGEIKANLTKPTGMKRKLSDTSLAKQHGWNPQTSLETGIRETVKWFESREEVTFIG
jgi:GDP-L-fucose synthase